MNAIVAADALATFVEFATTVTEEAVLHLNDDELALTARDPANVTLVDLTLDASAFEAYEANGGRIGLNLERFANVVGMADSDELVHLELDADTRTLRVEIGALDYTVGLIDPDVINSDTEVPNVLDNLTAHLVIEAGKIHAAHRAADLCGEEIAFEADADSGAFYADSSGDTDHARYEWSREDTEDGTKITSDATSLFSLDYQKDVFGPIPAGRGVTIHLGSEFPMVVDTTFAGGAGDARWSVAPRVGA